MRRLIATLVLCTGISVFFTNCNKKDAQNAVNSFTATIGTNSFKATGSAVVTLIAPNPNDASKTELTVTASSGNSVLTIAIPDYVEGNALGTYSFDMQQAIGGYADGSGNSDDVIISGSITLNVSGGVISGSFEGTTYQNVQITNGSFTVVP